MIDSIREMLGIALKYMGKSVNTLDKDELKALAEMMVETKSSKYFAGFDVGTGGRSKVVAGTAIAALVYNGDALRAVADAPEKIAFANPREGGVIWADNMAIPAGAPMWTMPTHSSIGCWMPRTVLCSPTGPSMLHRIRLPKRLLGPGI